MAREGRTDNITLAKVAAMCSADPDVSGWLKSSPSPGPNSLMCILTTHPTNKINGKANSNNSN